MSNRCIRCGVQYESEILGGFCPHCMILKNEAGEEEGRKAVPPRPPDKAKPQQAAKAPAVPGTARKTTRNIPVRCPCGLEFYVPAKSRGLVNCPSCDAQVPVAAPPAPAAPAPAPAPAPAGKDKPLALLIAVSSGVLVILMGVFLLLMATREDRPAPRPRTEARDDSAPPESPGVRVPAVIVETGTAPAPATEPIPRDDGRIAQRELEALVARANMTGLLATLLLYSGQVQEHDDLHSRLVDYEQRIRGLIARGVPQAPGAYFQSWDRLFWFAGQRLDVQYPQAFLDGLRSWLRTFQPGAKAQGDVQRGGTPVTITFYFPERTDDLLQLLKEAENPAVKAPPRAAPVPLPSDLLAEVRSRYDSLHAYYRKTMPPADDERMKGLLAAGKGTPEDVNFLKDRILSGLLKDFADEHAGFMIRLKDIETRVLEATSCDVVIFKDGRRIEGTIEEETEDQIKIKSRYGSIRSPKADIQQVERGKGAGVEFRPKYDAARGNPQALAALMAWCRERKLEAQKELAGYALLALDPGHAGARGELNVPAIAAPRISLDPEARQRGNQIEWNGDLYTPEELSRKLAARGYIQLSGLWCEKIPRTYKIDNLYRAENQIILYPYGASVVNRLENREESFYDMRSKSWRMRRTAVPVSRHIGLSGTTILAAEHRSADTGVCYLEVQSPGEVAECRVKAVSQILSVGGYAAVAVSASVWDPSPKILYTLSTVGTNDSTYDATDKVRGLTKFFIRAEVRNSGLFLPGDSSALGLLEVRYSYGKPLERINVALGLRRQGPGAVPEAPTPGVGAGLDNDAAEKAASVAADGALSRSTRMVDLMIDVRRLMGGIQYGRDLPVPARFSTVTIYVSDPLQARLEEMPAATILEMQKWWDILTLQDRREFLSFFGLWCARTRYQRETGR